MGTPLSFLQVDVFTDRPFFGNPVAVVLDADELSSQAMQRIARWTNLSETTFVLKPTDARADYRLRIFTPERELPFAGHPTLGSARAVLQSGRLTRHDAATLIQECEAGLVNLRRDGDRLFFEVPPARTTLLSAADALTIAQALGLDSPIEVPRFEAPKFEAINVGPVWLTAALRDADQVHALSPDFARLADLSRRLGATGVTVYANYPADFRDARGDAVQVAVRSFAPAAGVPEDPVCGSGNACVALQRRASGEHHDYTATQGEVIGREGRIAVAYRGQAIEIGGDTVVAVEGGIRVD
jgi:predicted PhzF superfamily epimerase YddE/YHI9